MSSIVSAARRLELQKVIARIFGYAEPTLKPFRSGRKYIKPLQGPKYLAYYPTFDIHSFMRKHPGINWIYETPEEKFKKEMRESRKARGKGAPKKKNGRRAAINKK